MKEFKPCGTCVHFFVCCNMYGDVDKDTVIKNIDDEPCYYYNSEVVARTTYDRLLKAYKKSLEDNESLRGEIEDLELKMSYHDNNIALTEHENAVLENEISKIRAQWGCW